MGQPIWIGQDESSAAALRALASSTPCAQALRRLVECDGVVRRQRVERLRGPDSITLSPLLYMSELNPMESIRDYRRGNKFTRRVPTATRRSSPLVRTPGPSSLLISRR